MAKDESLTVTLPADLADRIRRAVEAGAYASPGEVVREALADWSDKRRLGEEAMDDLRRLWQDGLNSGPAKDGPAVMAALRRRYAAANGSDDQAE